MVAHRIRLMKREDFTIPLEKPHIADICTFLPIPSKAGADSFRYAYTYARGQGTFVLRKPIIDGVLRVIAHKNSVVTGTSECYRRTTSHCPPCTANLHCLFIAHGR